eukprot:12336413-Alexandrium_andersonii.AAC.1
MLRAFRRASGSKTSTSEIRTSTSGPQTSTLGGRCFEPFPRSRPKDRPGRSDFHAPLFPRALPVTLSTQSG